MLPLPSDPTQPQDPTAMLGAQMPAAPAQGIDALRQQLDTELPATSAEVDVQQEPALPQEQTFGADQALAMPSTQDNPQIKRALAGLYGSSFPLLEQNPTEQSWITWAKNLWDRHEPGVRARLHLIQRNRLFRKGIQWITSQGGFGAWKEPAKPRDAARIVYNMIAPALDQRVQIVSEQRPGFRVEPATRDPDDLKKAEACQLALEYQYRQQEMPKAIREAEYWAGTDGVVFWELYWDANRGPWHQPQAPQQPGMPQQPPGGMPPQGATPPQPQPQMSAALPPKFRMGDISKRLRRIENVRVSSEATATQAPWYWVVKEIIPKSFAIKEYGLQVGAELTNSDINSDVQRSTIPSFAQVKSGFLLPQEDELLREQETVERLTVYCEKSDYLGQGLHLVIVGDKVVAGPMGLLWGEVPMVRITDGSSDPSFFPRPIMDDWLDSQQRINAVMSKWVENVRINAGPKLLAKLNSIVSETLVGSTASVINVKGLEGLDQLVRPLDGMSLAPDAKELLALEKKAFEDLSGYNDTSRGSFSADQSGRAILAIRESLERIYTPVVNAMADGMQNWAKITLAGMRWGYDLPRSIGAEGHGRPDLATALSSDDLDGAVDVWVDPETMIPMPRALRLFLLDDMYQKGLIALSEYRRRVPFAFVGNLDSPDDDQSSRAKRCAEAIRQGQWLPILWQDDEAIHQDILQRELILPDDTPMPQRQMALQRWTQLGQQQAMKQGIMPPGPPQQSGSQGHGKPASTSSPQAHNAGMSPGQQPLLQNNPSVAANSATSQQQAGQSFDSRSQR